MLKAGEAARMTGLVVITRPRDEAAELAAELDRLGYRTLIEPMLEIASLPAPIPSLRQYRALVFTSANGVRAFADRSSERAIPAFAVGARTAVSLRSAGFATVHEAAGDSEVLAAMICSMPGAKGPVLHLSGKAVAGDLGALLAPAGIPVDRLALYDAVPVHSLSSVLVAELYARTIEYVLFFSARTAGTFGTLLRERGLANMITSSYALCLSSQVAAQAATLPWRRVKTAPGPTAEALVGLLPALGSRDAG
jgi:uroporphyrinogen-III synthase